MSRILQIMLALAAFFAVFTSPLHAQKKGGMETFEEIDPYTRNDPEKLARLGYVQVGSFGWADGHRTEQVQEAMGGLDFLWIETEHFRIGSSLGTYKIPNDRTEKEKLKDEFKVLKKKLGRFRPPKKELDPWIRIHLFALRAEAQWAQHVQDFGLEAMAEDKEKPYLGHPKKFLLLICERKSELGRYLRVYHNTENEYSFASGKPDATMLFALNNEVLKEAFKDEPEHPGDTMLHTRVADGLARNFLNGHRQKLFAAPTWLVEGAAHHAARQVSPRLVLAGPGAQPTNDDHWEWDKRVEKLVDNDFFASLSDMFGWADYKAMNERDYLIARSKFEFLMLELEGDLTTFLSDVVTAIPEMKAGSSEELVKRQTIALAANFDLTPDEFDEEWQDWAEDQ